jgi:hypothetical protein
MSHQQAQNDKLKMSVSNLLKTNFYPLKTHIISAFIFLNLLTCLHIYAQDGLQDKQLVIEKNRVLELSKANRLQNRMQKIETPPPNSEQNYQLNKIQAPLPTLTITATAKTLSQDELVEKSYDNYLKAGFGNYTTLFGELFLQTPKNENYSLALTAKHLSSATGSILEEKSGNNRTNIGLQGNYKLTEDSEIAANISYQRLGLHYYGANPLILKDLDIETIKQTYQTIDFSAAYKAKVSDEVSYLLQSNYYHFSTKTDVSENAFAFKGETKIKLSQDANLNFALNLNFANRNDNTKNISTSINRNLLIFKPMYNLTVDNLRLNIGANLVYDNDTLTENSKFRIYPHLQIAYSLGKQTSIYGLVTGTTQQTSLRQFANENTFIGNQIPLLHTNKQWEAVLGIEGKLSQLLGYHLKGSYAQYKNMYFYNNSLSDSSKFTVLYDTEGTKLLNLMAEIHGQVNGIKASFKTEFFAYNMGNVAKAWHRPNFVNTLTISYLYENKLLLSSEIFNQSGLKGYNFTSQKEYDLTTIFDANLQASYQITNTFAAFVKLNNIFSQRYQQYLYYDNQRFNALLGIMWRF